jgi:hypothetical protein
MRKGSLIAVFAAVATFFMVAQVASAQYPPPKTTLVCAVNQIDIEVGGTTVVAATLQDASGSPLAGYTVNFEVVSGGATLSSSSAVTDDSGTAVVSMTINTSGTVIVNADSESAECQASIDIEGTVAPIAEVQSIVPPTTGDAGLLTDDSEAATFAGLALVFALMTLGLVTLRQVRGA